MRSRARTGRRTGGLGYQIVYQGAVLAAVSIIVRLIGMAYRIPLVSILQYEGHGYYTSAFSIYTLLLLFSSYSAPVALSCLVSEDLTEGRYKNIERRMKVAFWYATCVGLLGFVVLWFGAEEIAAGLRKPFSEYALRALAPAIWLMAYLSVLRGYFQGRGNMMPTGISQILEQTVNAIVSLAAAKWLSHKGMIANRLYETEKYRFAFGAEGAAIGTVVGILTAVLFFVMLYRMEKRYRRRRIRRDEMEADSLNTCVTRYLKTLVPFLLISVVYNSTTVIDDFLYGNISNLLGRTGNLAEEWGVYGEYHTLFNVPVALASAMTLAVVPALTMAVRSMETSEIEDTIRRVIRATMLVAIPSGVGLLVLAKPIATMLFPGKQIALLIRLLQVGSAATVFYSLAVISTGILQGLGDLMKPLFHAVVALLLHIVVLSALLFGGSGMYGVVLSHILFAALMSAFNMLAIYRYYALSGDVLRTYALPFLASLLMGVIVFGLSRGFERWIPGLYEKGQLFMAMLTIPMCLLGIVLYIVALRFLRIFRREDAEQMPFVHRLMWTRKK